eukprot:2291345-Prymnesium_polylepis.2
MMIKLMYPHDKGVVACAGKGGNQGAQYMMERGRQMLVAQGHSGEPAKIMMVGDRFDTDVRAGLSAGFATCLVTSGCHTLAMQKSYRADPAHYHAPGVGALLPLQFAERCSAHEGGGAAAPLMAADGRDAGADAAGKAAREGRRGTEEAMRMLQGWALVQSNQLAPGAAEMRRAELQPLLRLFFNSVDINGDGRIDRLELKRTIESLGMAHLLEASDGAAATAETPLASPERSPDKGSARPPRAAILEAL